MSSETISQVITSTHLGEGLDLSTMTSCTLSRQESKGTVTGLFVLFELDISFPTIFFQIFATDLTVTANATQQLASISNLDIEHEHTSS